MASDVYTISFVLEKIHQNPEPSFELRIRLEGHEWCNVGEVEVDDLPVGFTFTTILTSFERAQMFAIDISLTNRSSFSAQLQLPKHPQTDVLSSRGMSILYPASRKDHVLAVTIAVKITKYYHVPTQHYEITLRQTETQTERTDTRSVYTQVRQRRSTTASNTDLHLLSAAELEDTVANVVAQHLHLTVSSTKSRPPALEPKSVDAKPIVKTLEENLGKSLVPRLQKLRVLDRMIGERVTIVEHFDANFVKQEIARKRAFILKCRTVKEKLFSSKKTESSQIQASSGASQVHEVATQYEMSPPSSESTASASETTSESTEESEEIEDSNESTSMSEKPTSSSDKSASSSDKSTSTNENSTFESSTSSSKETILRKNSPITPLGKMSLPNKQEHRAVQVSEVPEPSLSPTSLYLKQLRERILKERMEKI